MSWSLIVAVGPGGVIGRKGQLPWRLPEDLRRFKSLTMSHHLIMGRSTYDSLGRCLPGRTSVVLSRQIGLKIPGAVVCSRWDQVQKTVALDSEPFVIGGGEIYQTAWPWVDRVYLTEVLIESVPDGDTFFEIDRLAGWTIVEASERMTSSHQGISFQYRTYARPEPAE